MAKPHEGSRNRVAQEEKEPATGYMTANSPKAWQVKYSIKPTKEKAKRSDAGPPSAKARPEATKRPVPIVELQSEDKSKLCA
jgi:hypothetical protein